jgi:alpha-ketoglutarate-dependent taurine dioxygenase
MDWAVKAGVGNGAVNNDRVSRTPMSAIQNITERLPFSDRRFPLIFECGIGAHDLAEFISKYNQELESKLLNHGALLFRGFSVNTVEGFDRVLHQVTTERAAYVYRSTPRTAIANGIYTATEYPPQLDIPLHNENAYARRWPLRLAFCCLKPAASGGETPLADMQRVTAALGEDLLGRFESRRIQYVRHYHPYVDLSWQVVFQTDDRNVVASYCKENALSYEWIDDEILQTVQVCQGTARHPATQFRLFFNQAHLFHVSNLGAENAEVMLEIYGRDRLPRHARFGDGGEIDARDLERISAAFRDEARSVPWEAGDVLLLDNMQMAHGRRPFEGARKVVAALLEMYSDPSVVQAADNGHG